MSNKRRKKSSTGNKTNRPDQKVPQMEEPKDLPPEEVEEIDVTEWDMEAIFQEDSDNEWEELGDDEEVYAGASDPEADEDEDEFSDEDDGFAWEQNHVMRRTEVPPSRGLMVLTVVLLFVVVVLLCVILWRVTHVQRDTSLSSGVNTQDTWTEETLSMESETAESTEPETEEAGTEETETEETIPETQASPEPTPYVEDGQVYTDPVSGDSSMSFTEIEETVTAKDITNIRYVPDTTDPANVVHQLQNGETLTRTGINSDTGWSRLEYDGQTVYAVSQYLTTDLNYKPPVAATDPNRITTQDGRVIIFEAWDDYITPKEYVNLRVEPSTSQGRSTVNSQVNTGTVVHRTGRSADSGWSRVEYNGRTLYVVSSYMTVTDATAASTPTPTPAPTPTPEPQVSEPQVSEPQVSEPQVSEPQVSEPQVQQPQVPNTPVSGGDAVGQ